MAVGSDLVRTEIIDADRVGFVRRNFRSDAADASLYDIVLNASTLGVEGCVEVITRALEIRQLV